MMDSFNITNGTSGYGTTLIADDDVNTTTMLSTVPVGYNTSYMLTMEGSFLMTLDNRSDIRSYDMCRVHPLCTSSEERAGYLYVIPILATVGIIFNVLNLVVFTRKNFRLTESMLVFLTALAAVDLFALLVAWPSGFIRCKSDNISVSSKITMNSYDVYVYIPFNNMFGTCSAFLTVIIALERYIYVCHPIFAKKVCKAHMAKTCVLGTSLLALTLNFPFVFFREITDDGDISISNFGHSIWYRMFSWLRMFVVKIFPILAVAMLNFLLVRAVYKASRKAHSTIIPMNKRKRGKQYAQNRMTAMLLSITFVFLLCNALEPIAHTKIYVAIFGDQAKCKVSFAIFRMVMNVVEMISWTTNFVSYCIFNRRFVYVLAVTFRCRVISRESQQIGITSFSGPKTRPLSMPIKNFVEVENSTSCET